MARLAGGPPAVVGRAQEVLARLEGQEAPPSRLDDLPLFATGTHEPEPPRRSLVEAALQDIEPDELSPREALDILYRLKGLKT